MLPPSEETKTSVFSWVEPAKAEAISSIAAVEAMVEAAPVPVEDVAVGDHGDLALGGPGKDPDQVPQLDLVAVVGSR